MKRTKYIRFCDSNSADSKSPDLQIGLIERHGYPAEEHRVTTEDGYNLLIHRIPGNPWSNNKKAKTVVFLQHGILCTSDCWVLFGSGKDLGWYQCNKK